MGLVHGIRMSPVYLLVLNLGRIPTNSPPEGIFSRSFAQQSGGGEGAVKSLSPGTRPAVTTESWVSGTDGHFASVASALKVKLRRWVSLRSGASSGEAAVATT